MAHFAGDDQAPVSLATKQNTGVVKLRQILSDLDTRLPTLEKFILLSSTYDKNSHSSFGHFVAFRKNIHDEWVCIDSCAHGRQNVQEPRSILPDFNTSEQFTDTANNGPEYQILFYASQYECAAWQRASARLAAQNIFSLSIPDGARSETKLSRMRPI